MRMIINITEQREEAQTMTTHTTRTTRTTRTDRARTLRKRLLAASALTGAVVLSLGAGVGAARATGTTGTIDIGHVDGIHVALNTSNSRLVLGTNVDEADYLAGSGFDPGYYLGSEVNAAAGTPAYDFTVPHANYDYDPTGFPNQWVLPAAEPADFATDPILYLGIAGTGEDLVQHGTSSTVAHSLYRSIPAGKHVTVKIELVSAPAGGTSTIPSATGAGTTISPWQFVYTLPPAPNAEPIHQHVDWTFDTAGVYTFTVTASTDQTGVIASAPVTYRFTVL
jgi:surface-anchored protein